MSEHDLAKVSSDLTAAACAAASASSDLEGIKSDALTENVPSTLSERIARLESQMATVMSSLSTNAGILSTLVSKKGE
ncbi:hypothetical protein [Sphingobium yanoikuyae]|uniref:hypothetical protein n=1 Tax=Sphingobium yanoikuyae TaxID=13690 RepID=UPI0028DC54A3|nr:hypothetical protein [Sphingobium yanoikuyae]